MKILTQKDDVVIRELLRSDLQDMVIYANNENVSNNLRDAFPSPYTFKDAENFYNMVSGGNPRNEYVIEYKGEYVGNIGLSVMGDVYRKSAELGYFIGEPFWNRGIVTKAVELMVDYGFKSLDIIRIFAEVFEFNKASQRVLEKCGFDKEAILKKAIFKKGEIFDEIIYAKLKC